MRYSPDHSIRSKSHSGGEDAKLRSIRTFRSGIIEHTRPATQNDCGLLPHAD
jgi:hypothetical protein